MSTTDRFSSPYWAFVSYSHEDGRLARQMQRRLERIRIPPAARAGIAECGLDMARLRPIFRDDSELATGDLGEQIREALARSAWLIVVATPRSARSHWVEAEIREFVALGRADRILLLVADGKPRLALDAGEALDLDAAFSPALSELARDSVWADARQIAGGRERAFVRLAAGMLGLGFDVLWRRERRRSRRRLATAAVLIAGVLSVVGLLAYVQAQPVDIADCRLGAIVFRDPWTGSEFRPVSVGAGRVWLCNDGIVRSLEAARASGGHSGPYGPTVLKGVLEDATRRHPDRVVYFVYNRIRGLPSSWWDALDEVDVQEVLKLEGFRWLPLNEQPRMSEFGFASIELDDTYSTVSVSLDLSWNPLIGMVCDQTRLEVAIEKLCEPVTGD